MPNLIVLRGNSGSGKTSTAKRLQRHFGRNTLLISQDMVRRDMLMVRDSADTPALPLLMELLRYCHSHCAVVILEGILNADRYRPLFLLARELFGDNIYAYYYDLPFAETLRRHQTKPNCGDFGETDMRAWWQDRDYSDVLSEHSLTQDLSQTATVELIIQALNHAL